MRQATRNGLITVMAAGGVLALTGVPAFADADAEAVAAQSSGVLSGNAVQAPVHAPVNACGNTVNAAGALNPAAGNRCAQTGEDGAEAESVTAHSSGIASGNTVQAPVHVPVNACGNTVNVVGVGNPALGNECATGGTEEERKDPDPEAPKDHESEPDTPAAEDAPDPEGDPGNKEADPVSHRKPEGETPAGTENVLAETGSDSALTVMLPLSAGLLLGGAVLYRRARAAARR